MNAYARALKHLEGVQYRVNHPDETPLRPGMNEGPVLVSGVTPFTSGTVVATVPVAATKPIVASIPLARVATAPIDASGRFVLRANPTRGPLAGSIVNAIKSNPRWFGDWLSVNIEARQGGHSRKAVSRDSYEEYVEASGHPFSLAEFRAAPGSGHWVSDHCGLRRPRAAAGPVTKLYSPTSVEYCTESSATINLKHESQYDR